MIANDVIPHNDNDDDDQCFGMVIGFTVTIVVLAVIIIGITAVMMWCLYKHKRGIAVFQYLCVTLHYRRLWLLGACTYNFRRNNL